MHHDRRRSVLSRTPGSQSARTGVVGSPPSRVGGRAPALGQGGLRLGWSLSGRLCVMASGATSGCRSGVIAGDSGAVRAAERGRSPSRGRSTSPIPARLSRRQGQPGQEMYVREGGNMSPRCVAVQDGSGSLWSWCPASPLRRDRCRPRAGCSRRVVQRVRPVVQGHALTTRMARASSQYGAVDMDARGRARDCTRSRCRRSPTPRSPSMCQSVVTPTCRSSALSRCKLKAGAGRQGQAGHGREPVHRRRGARAPNGVVRRASTSVSPPRTLQEPGHEGRHGAGSDGNGFAQQAEGRGPVPA